MALRNSGLIRSLALILFRGENVPDERLNVAGEGSSVKRLAIIIVAVQQPQAPP